MIQIDNVIYSTQPTTERLIERLEVRLRHIDAFLPLYKRAAEFDDATFADQHEYFRMASEAQDIDRRIKELKEEV